MNENKKRTGKTAIGCDAENCTYNERGVGCSAEHIVVDGKTARSTGETCCSTFKAKDHAKF